RRANVLPRQQVNQICRRLQKTGGLSRELGPQGKIVNVLKVARRSELPTAPLTGRPKMAWRSESGDPQDSGQHSFWVFDARKTLILICCSKARTILVSCPQQRAIRSLIIYPRFWRNVCARRGAR